MARNIVQHPNFDEFLRNAHTVEIIKERTIDFCRFFYQDSRAEFNEVTEKCRVPLKPKPLTEVPSDVIIRYNEGEAPMLLQGLGYGGLDMICAQLRNNTESYYDGALKYCRIPGEITPLKFTSAWNIVDARRNTLNALIETNHASTRETLLAPEYDSWIDELGRWEDGRVNKLIIDDALQKYAEDQESESGILGGIGSIISKAVKFITSALLSGSSQNEIPETKLNTRPYH